MATPHCVVTFYPWPGPDQPRPSGPGDSADREAYRRAGPSDEPKGGAGAGFKPEFVSVKHFKHQLHVLMHRSIICNLNIPTRHTTGI